jgi:hypothetical protein
MATRETHPVAARDRQQNPREGQFWPVRESDRLIVPMKRVTTAEGRSRS